MRPTTDTNTNSTSPLPTHRRVGTGAPARPEVEAMPERRPVAHTDRLNTNPDLQPTHSEDPHGLFQRVKQLRQEGDSHPIVDGIKQDYNAQAKPAIQDATKDVKAAMNSPQAQKARHKAAQASGFAALLGSAWNAIGGTPSTLVGNIQGLFYSSNSIVKGADTLRSAHRGAGVLSYLGDLAKGGWNTFKGNKWGSLKKLVGIGKPSQVASESKGFFGFFKAARAGGSGIAGSVAKAFGNTVDKGGNMPQIAAEAAQTGGKLGKLAVWAGRVGRVAPLLNVPIAAFDVKKAWDVFHDPKATTREKVSTAGTAVLGTAAAGLAVAGFVTPPPVDAALFAAAGIVGLSSMVWGAVTSKPVVDFAKKAGKAIGSAATSVGHALSGAAHSVAHFFGL